MTFSSQKRLSKLLQHCESTATEIHNNPTQSNKYNDIRFQSTPSIPLSHSYPSLANILRNIFHDRYSENPKILEKHGREVIGYARSSPPQAVIFPHSTQEIVQLLKICNTHSPPIPITSYAAGTSLESHILTGHGIILNCSEMNKILKIYPKDMQCIVQPGVNWIQLNKKLKAYNLFLGVDPAPAACIGGMIGTCCSGPSALKYGTMRQQIINLTMVLANGKMIKTGQRAVKSVAGYDLNSLFVGCEGTFGVIVEATLRLRVLPKYIEIAQASFNTLESIGCCIEEINASGVNLAAFELLDNKMIELYIKYDPKCKRDFIDNDGCTQHIIIFKFGGPSIEHVHADIHIIQNIVQKYSRFPFRFSSNAKERDRLWKLRKMAFWAVKFSNPGKEMLVTDVAVPFSNFSECIIRCKKEIESSSLSCPIVGHIGDGNWHSVIIFDKSKVSEIREAKRLNKFIVLCALDLDGTCTAEHGIGKHKKEFLVQELGEVNVDFMRSLKKLIDPNNILAPGNIVDV